MDLPAKLFKAGYPVNHGVLSRVIRKKYDTRLTLKLKTPGYKHVDLLTKQLVSKVPSNFMVNSHSENNIFVYLESAGLTEKMENIFDFTPIRKISEIKFEHITEDQVATAAEYDAIYQDRYWIGDRYEYRTIMTSTKSRITTSSIIKAVELASVNDERLAEKFKYTTGYDVTEFDHDDPTAGLGYFRNFKVTGESNYVSKLSDYKMQVYSNDPSLSMMLALSIGGDIHLKMEQVIKP